MLTVALICCLFLLALSALAVPLRARPCATSLVYGASLVLCAGAFLAGTAALLSGAPAEAAVLPLGLPWLGAHFALDPLAAFFLVVVNLGGAGASLYALGYGRHEAAPGRVLPFFPAFLAGMNGVVLAADAFSFLVAWEAMSLASWALVLAHHRNPDNVRAGYVYIVMAVFGALALLLAFAVLAGQSGGTYTFAAMGAAGPLSPWAGGLFLLLALLGAGSKAGVVPLHAWLPLAHPAAPSHVSALMSGVMTKVAVYGFIRIVFDLAGGAGPLGAGAVLALGGVTAVMGVLYALMQHDLKRLLAYHTVENIGIIFIGLGLALAFQSQAMPALAALALAAALFHVLNHSIFKSLLFFGSGAVFTATGERNMERLGGLIHRMPATALFFLVGCAAISALPPLNGFASEWMTFQAILQGPALEHWGLRVLVPLVGAMLALAAALAAACFVKVFGIVFLGRARSAQAAGAAEVDRFSLTAMGGLGVLCVVAGALPGLVVKALAPVTQALVGGQVPEARAWLSLAPVGHSAYSGLLVLAFIALASVLTAWLIHTLASRAVRRTAPWGCGFRGEDPAGVTQYTASSFAQPIRVVFGPYVFGAAQRVRMPSPGSLAPARFMVRVRDLIWHGLYTPLASGVLWAGSLANRFSRMSIRGYLGLVFAVLVLLLLGVALWS